MNGAALFIITATIYLTAKGKMASYWALVHAKTVSDTAAPSTASGAVAAAGTNSDATTIVPAAATTNSTVQTLYNAGVGQIQLIGG